MKKVLLFFFSFVIIILVFWAGTIMFFFKEDLQNIPSSADGIILTLKNDQISLNEPVLEINIENSNHYEVTYGSAWTIEKYTNERWERANPAEQSFTLELYAVEPHSSRTETVHLTSYVEGQLTVGKYRIIKEIEDKQGTRLLAVRFEIK
jgi:hypothetical protein